MAGWGHAERNFTGYQKSTNIEYQKPSPSESPPAQTLKRSLLRPDGRHHKQTCQDMCLACCLLVDCPSPQSLQSVFPSRPRPLNLPTLASSSNRRPRRSHYSSELKWNEKAAQVKSRVPTPKKGEASYFCSRFYRFRFRVVWGGGR